MKVIAESAYNHNGNLNYLLQLADAAKESGADYFTVQIMSTDQFCVPEYHKHTLYKENEFSAEQWVTVFEHCKKIDLPLIPCALDMASLELISHHDFELIKIHATDITNTPYLEFVCQEMANSRVVLETQATTLFEIRFATRVLGDQIECIMHGFSNYPTDPEELNLGSLAFLRDEFSQYRIGLADHSTDLVETPIFAMSSKL